MRIKYARHLMTSVLDALKPVMFQLRQASEDMTNVGGGIAATERALGRYEGASAILDALERHIKSLDVAAALEFAEIYSTSGAELRKLAVGAGADPKTYEKAFEVWSEFQRNWEATEEMRTKDE